MAFFSKNKPQKAEIKKVRVKISNKTSDDNLVALIEENIK